MPSILKISHFTGFSRDALTRRQELFGLGPEPSCKELFDLKPLDESHASKLSLEEARTELAVEQTRIARQQADKNDGNLADVDALMERDNAVFEGIAAIIRRSRMPEADKGDIFDLIGEHFKNWEKGSQA